MDTSVMSFELRKENQLTHRRVSYDRRQKQLRAFVNRVKNTNFAQTWRDLRVFGQLYRLPHRKC